MVDEGGDDVQLEPADSYAGLLFQLPEGGLPVELLAALIEAVGAAIEPYGLEGDAEADHDGRISFRVRPSVLGRGADASALHRMHSLEMPKLPSRAMASGAFWKLISTLGGEVTSSGAAALSSALRERGEKACIGFAEHLAAVLYALDARPLIEVPLRWGGEQDAAPARAPDKSLALRTAIVAMGRDFFEAVLENPRLIVQEVWSIGEQLVFVAPQALGRHIETRFNYEMGANEPNWSLA